MKKLSLILVMTIAASSFAQTNTLDITTVKKISTDEIVTSLKIYNNVEVILTDKELNEIQIVGGKTDVENTMVKINNGELTITSSSDDFFKDKVLVYVPSKSLATVYIHGGSSVSSTGILANEMLEVTINGDGKSTIQTSGYVNVNTIGDFPLETSAN
ncbi:MAG: DUF2807 domain-containing protein [Ferruginibacter sp.]|nr:DUF2807 domain-containing protein [Ferruginibacter sp.]